MSRLVPMSDLVADDLLLDQLGAREHTGGTEPVAGLLAALADQADTPLLSRAVRRRIGHRHRFVGPLAALAVAASGAGVAAAVTLPHHAPDPAEKARVVRQTEAALDHAPSAPLSGLGLPRTAGASVAQSLVMARRGDGVIVLVPAAAVVQPGAPGAGAMFEATAGVAARDGGTARADGAGQGGSGQPGNTRPSGGHDGSPATGNGQGGNGRTENGASQGGNEQGSGTSGTSGGPTGGHTATPQPRSTDQKQTTGGQSSQGSGGQGGATTASPSGSSASGGQGGQRPSGGATATPRPATSPATSTAASMLIPVLSPDPMVLSTASPTTPPSR